MEKSLSLGWQGAARRSFAAIVTVGVFVGQVQAVEEAPKAKPSTRITAEDFGALPFLTSPVISPDGHRAAARVYANDELRLIILNLDEMRSEFGAIPIPDKRDLRWYRWAGNDRLLLGVGQSATIEGGFPVYVTRLLMIDFKTMHTQFVGQRREGMMGDDVIYVAPDGSSILLNMQDSAVDYPSVWRVDLNTLKMKRVVPSRDYVWDWYADSAGVVRAGIGQLGKRWWLLYRGGPEDDFKKIVHHTSDDEEKGNIEKFVPTDGSDSGFVVTNSKTSRFALYKYDFKTDTIGEAIYENPKVDIDDLVQSERGDIVGVRYTDDRSRVEWFDPEFKAWQAKIDRSLPNHTNRIVSINADQSRIIVYSRSAADPGRYFFFEPAKNVIRLIAEPFDRVDAAGLSDMESTSYRARDGLEIPAYLTLPRGLDPKNLPLVVMPHGGPFARDEWGYDVWVQFLANRGYVVLQPNFREQIMKLGRL